MRIGRDQAELVKAFAAAKGCKLRNAQIHRQRQSPEWLEFIQKRAAGVSAPAAVVVPVLAPEAGETAEMMIERVALENWQRIAGGIASAVNDPNVAAMVRAEQLAAKSYRDAKRARENAEVSAGRLVPVAQVNDLRKRFIQPLRALLENMPSEVGPRANTFDPVQGMAACEEWLRNKFTPKLREASDAFEQIKQPEQ